MDGFVDSAFAFAVTLLVIAGGAPPQDIEALSEALRRVPAFALSLAVLLWLWAEHRKLTMLSPCRDGLSDALTIAVVLVVLVYVYPLRLLSEAMLHWASQARLPGPGLVVDDLQFLYTAYGLGAALISLLYAALFLRAAEQRERTSARRKQLRLAGCQWGLTALSALSAVAAANMLILTQLPWLPAALFAVGPALSAYRLSSIATGQKEHARTNPHVGDRRSRETRTASERAHLPRPLSSGLR